MAKGKKDSCELGIKILPKQEVVPQNNTGTYTSTQTPILPCDGAIGGCEIDNNKLSNLEEPLQKTDSDWIQADENGFTQQEICALLRTDDPDSTGTSVPSTRSLIRSTFRTQLNNEDSEGGKVVPSGTCISPPYSCREKTTEGFCPSGGGFKENNPKHESEWNHDIHQKIDKYLDYKQLKKIHSRHHRERKTIPEEDCGPIHHHSAERQKTTELELKKLKDNVSPCIGKIVFKGKFLGTCICVGGNDHRSCCLTAFHVIQSAIGMTDHGLEEECYQHTTAQFPCGIFFMKNIHQPEINLDYGWFELKPNDDNGFPVAWTKFGTVPKDISKSVGLYIVGYQDGTLEWDSSAMYMNISVSEALNKIKPWYREKFQNEIDIATSENIDMKYHFVISTKFISGSSGGLVIIKDENGEFVGIGIVITGYPKQYYTKLDLKQKAEVKGCYLFELALSFQNLEIKQLLFCDQG